MERAPRRQGTILHLNAPERLQPGCTISPHGLHEISGRRITIASGGKITSIRTCEFCGVPFPEAALGILEC